MTTLTSTKILVVEDEAIIAEDISASLKRLGYPNTSTACTAPQSGEFVAFLSSLVAG